MATLGDLKAAIIADMDRDDLADESAATLTRHIRAAIEYYADQQFWFNQAVVSVSTVADVATVAIPASMRVVDRVAARFNNLTPIELSDFPDDGGQPLKGAPQCYAFDGGDLRLFPTPDAVYPLGLYGIAQINAPAQDVDSNAWTTEAFALIAARVRFTLYRDVFRDPEGAEMAMGGLQEALTELKMQSERRLRTRPVMRLTRPSGMPVRRYATDRW